MLRDFLILSSEAPPPISKKVAGSPPWNLIMSIPVNVKPAPLPITAISPSNLTKSTAFFL